MLYKYEGAKSDSKQSPGKKVTREATLVDKLYFSFIEIVLYFISFVILHIHWETSYLSTISQSKAFLFVELD